MWEDAQECVDRVSSIQRDLQNLALFKEVHVEPLDACRIQALYRSIKTDCTVQIPLKQCVELDSEIDNVEQVIIGSITADDFLTLITDNSSEIKKSVFTDNIRDFQGDKGVNQEIRQTIESDPSKFFLYNNGVTIICKKITALPKKKYELIGYQIVNGCQTSHVIYNSRNTDGLSDISLPIKLIQTTDGGIINSVIKATNHQTAIKDDQLLTLSEYHKSLEDYFKTFPVDKQLFYERRSRQFVTDSTVDRKKIVSIKTLVSSVAAMFYDKPHFSSRYYGRLVDSLSGKLFKTNHKPINYYTASYAHYKIERFCKLVPAFKPYYRYRYHFLMMLAYSLRGKFPEFHTKKSEKFCESVLAIVNDQKEFQKRMQKFLDILRKYVDDPKSEQYSKSADIVDNLKSDTIQFYHESYPKN